MGIGKLIAGRSTDLLPQFFTLPLGDTTTPEISRWNRVYFERPGVVVPHRNDFLTGTADLRFITIRYAPRKPLTQEAGFSESDVDAGAFIWRGLGTGPCGTCYIWEPGEWYIYVSCGQAVPASPTSLPFIFFPSVPELRATPSEWSRVTAHRPGFAGTLVAAGASTKLISVQELLDGVRGLELATNTAGSNVRFRWVDVPGGNLYLPVASTLRFEGQFLPLADLWILNNGAGAITVQRAFYF